MMRLYRHALSGHCHRVELFLSLIGKTYERVDMDLMAGEHKQNWFLDLNPFGQVPVLDDDGHVVADSNAILVYLAREYAEPAWYPTSAEGAALVQRWLSVAAGELAHGPAAARLVTVLGFDLDHARAKATAETLLSTMNVWLGERSWLAGHRPTIADVALYTYVAHAPEGCISLDPYPYVGRWVARIEELPGFVAMESSHPAGAA